jgi:DNA modification methylase
MKPVDLIQYQMSNSSKPNHIILDTFGGSGTTLIAAERIQRQARLVELDPRYCDVIIKRWENFTGNKAERVVFN